MSSPCRCVGATIASSIRPATKSTGGTLSRSMPCPLPGSCGSKPIPMKARPRRKSRSRLKRSKDRKLMATEKQIAANRQNAKSSTGPRTEYGKRRSRRNAMRHGLTAETVIDVLEDPAGYKALQRAIYADYRPRSNFELQLVGRLVSLLWRLRRAVAIESGLLSIQGGHSRKLKENPDTPTDLDSFYRASRRSTRRVCQ